MNTIRVTVTNHLDPDHDQQVVGPDLGPNCLQNNLETIVAINKEKELKGINL